MTGNPAFCAGRRHQILFLFAITFENPYSTPFRTTSVIAGRPLSGWVAAAGSIQLLHPGEVCGDGVGDECGDPDSDRGGSDDALYVRAPHPMRSGVHPLIADTIVRDGDPKKTVQIISLD